MAQSGRCDLAWAKCLKIISDGVQSCTRTWVPQQDLNINKVVNKFRAQVNASFNGTRLVIAQLRNLSANGMPPNIFNWFPNMLYPYSYCNVPGPPMPTSSVDPDDVNVNKLCPTKRPIKKPNRKGALAPKGFGAACLQCNASKCLKCRPGYTTGSASGNCGKCLAPACARCDIRNRRLCTACKKGYTLQKGRCMKVLTLG
ncbi:hypothetical protein CHLNCDRAFT_140644 [Chlorella variabilis]|uniref:Uncharacterized protein n=1 Tax=Chlorella variabilis TaxID=554065 RepID=E1Z5V5_CHLVA|nr:hypothetical protein CHLNCDRAFT_140644 [Chlorella variabilis]EFN58540.1 hypothetical protein CHLNCDRAFT_140644 [Chlorella variabilis]|eukprot:XP_005850642.1 hypothetical protein CHLNCDRAFT_140644 [Chlorella variabilis]